MRPWWVPKRWAKYTDRAGSRDWAMYAMCRVVGHRVAAEADGFTWCARCGDTMPDGFNRWQK